MRAIYRSHLAYSSLKQEFLRILCLGLGASLLLASCATPVSPQVQATAHYDRGVFLQAKGGNEAEAEAEFKQAIVLDPQFAPPHNALGQLWSKQPKHTHDEIIAEYEQAVRLDANFAEAHRNLGEFYVNDSTKLREAVAHLQDAVRINPDYASAWALLGDALRTTGDWQGAIAAYRRNLELDPKTAYNWFRLGSTLTERAGHDFEAISCFENALKLDPGHTNQLISHTNLGILLMRKSGRGAEAIRHLEEATRLEPKLAHNWSNLGSVQYQLGDHVAAMASVEKSLALDPQSFAAYQLRGDLRQAKQDPIGALADYEKSSELNPQNFRALMQIGFIQQQQGDPKAAIKAYSKVIAVYPKYAAAYAYRAATQLEQKDFSDALVDVSYAIKLEPEVVWYWGMRAELNFRQKDFKAALDDCEHVIATSPEDDRAWLMRSYIRLELGNLEGAAKDADWAITLKPEIPNGYALRGRIRTLTGDPVGAISDYTACIKIGPPGTPAYFERGIDRELVDDFSGALKDYERAMELGTSKTTYVGYWSLLLRLRLNRPASEQDLKSRGLGAENNEWMKVLTGFFKGELDEEALFAKAKDASPMKGTEQKCEAYYYAAMRRLLVAHDPEGARPLFEQCVATNVRKFIEIPSAKLELERMKRAPKAKQGGPERVEAEEKRTKNKEPGLTSGPDRSASLPCSTTW